MSERAWFRSLYSRIAFGFVVLLAGLLLAQGLLFFWLTGRFDESPQGRTSQQTADFIARELSDELSLSPTLDLETYVRSQFEDIHRGFAVIMRDGRHVANRPNALPPGFMERGGGRGGGPGGPAGPRPGGEPRPPDRGEPVARGRGRRGSPGGPGAGGRVAPIVVNGSQVGIVAVPPTPPTWVLVDEYAATLTWVGLALLAAGATVAALVIFRPTHKRLRSLEAAARALAQGRTDVRASEAGGDEVSTLAHEFNRMADDLQHRAAALSASDRARRQLLADVSHELMTPLTAIRGYIETLSMPDLPIDAATRNRYFDVVSQETYRLEAIVGDLLDVARLEGSGEPLKTLPVSVEDLFRRIVDRHQPTLQQNGISVTVDVAPDAEDVQGDAQRLEQALQNLASNAIRHMPDGGALVLRSQRDGERVRITVEDTGPGISHEHLPHVFDRFYKADASRAGTKIPSGSGLGLSIVQTIVSRHGGEVHATNRSGGGAAFEILLPGDNSVAP
ncbi:MAG: HAMP domain-containing sensor histidine kinase [Vicinamibacterales bacterium]